MISTRTEKTHLESRTRDMSADICKFAEKIDFYKNQISELKMNYDREHQSKLLKEEKIGELNKQVENLNLAINDYQLEKRSLKIAEDQYRSAIVERDRNIKRQSNEIDQLTNRLADSAKMTDGIRRDKTGQNEEIFRLTTLIKKEKVQNEKFSEDILDLKKSNTDVTSELSALKREFNSQALELDQSNGNYKKKIEELKQNDKAKEILMKTIEDLRHKLLSKQAKVEEVQMLGENEIFQNKEALRISR